MGTIAGALSVYNKLFFKSGSVVLGETGWWKLLHNFSPAVAAHISKFFQAGLKVSDFIMKIAALINKYYSDLCILASVLWSLREVCRK